MSNLLYGIVCALYHKADWTKFTHSLKNSYINIPSELTECKLDKMVSKLNHILNKAIDCSCPLAKAKSVDPNNPWWTPQLNDTRRRVTKTYDKYKNDRKNESLEKLYKKQQKEYKKLKRKTKNNFEHMQNESVENEEAMAKKVKNLTSSIQPKVTTLLLPSGKHTEVGEETCRELMTKHFP